MNNYINVNICCSEEPLISIMKSNLIDSVYSSVDNGDFLVDNFKILVFTNIRGTRDGNNLKNVLDMKKQLDVKIRLTSINDNLSYDLKDFVIDLSDKSKLQDVGIKYFEQIDIIEVKDLKLKSNGDYIIKVLIKEKNDDLYDLHCIHKLIIN